MQTTLSCTFGLALAAAVMARPGSDDDAVVRPAVVRYTIDPAKSEVGFDGTSSLHDFTGRTREVSGFVLVDPLRPTAFLAGKVECRAASLDTDNDSRDEKMWEHLDVEHHPVIGFTLARGEGDRSAAHEVDLAGSFAIHGVQREYHITATTEVNADGTLHAKGRVPLKLTDHGIVPPAVMMIEVGDLVHAWYDLVLVPAKVDEVDARAYPITLLEHIEPIGGVASDERHAETLFVAADGVLWERAADGLWMVEQGGRAPRCVALATGADAPRAMTAEESFAEARETMARLQEKLDKLSGAKREKAEGAVAETLTRLRAVLAEAPAEGALTRTTVADGEVWSLGGRTWLELHGQRGPGRIAPLLTCLEGLPTAVRDALATVGGVPARIVVRTATMGGVRSLELQLGEAVPARIPRTALTQNTEATK